MVDPRLPTTTQSWQLDINNAAAERESETANNRKTVFAIKNSLITFAQNPWTVHSSSDSVNVTGDSSLGLMPEESNNTSASIDFDGVGEWIIVGNKSELSFDSTDAFSISCWFKGVLSVAGVLVSKREGLTPFRGYELRLESTGAVRFSVTHEGSGVNMADVTTTSTGFDDGIWHHVVATKSTSQSTSGFSIYVDGSLEAFSVNFDNLTNTSLTQQGFQIGGRGGPNALWNGEIAQVSIYDKELTAGEVTTIFQAGTTKNLSSIGPFANLVGYWRMGVGATFPTIPDDSTNSNDGEMVNMVSSDILLLGEGAPTNMESVDFGDLMVAAGTIADFSSNSNPGIPVNLEDSDFTTDTPGGFSSYSVTLDGVNEDVRFGNVPELDFAHTDEFSVSCWIKYTSTTGIIVGKTLNAGTFRGYFASAQASGEIAVVLRNDTSGTQQAAAQTTSTGWNDGAWHHVVYTWNGTVSQSVSNIHIYVDGNDEPLTTLNDNLTGTISNTAEFIAGSRTGAFWAGQIDEISVYDKALSLSEVQAIYNSGTTVDLSTLTTEPDMVGWFGMGENIVLTTAAATFDGVDEYIDMNDVSGLSFERNRPFSMSAWIKWSTDHVGIVVGKQLGSGTFRGYSFGVNTSGRISGTIKNTNTTNEISFITTSTDWNDGDWHHIAITYDGSSSGSGVSIYIDGISQTVSLLVDNLTATILTSADFQIGARSVADFYHGSVDEVAIYNKELSSSEVSTIYNSGAPPDLNAIGPFSNLVGYWFMGEGVATSAAADLWIDFNDLVWSTGNHSWIVLNKPSTGSQILISLDRTSTRDLIMHWSPGGLFTGGTISTDPTASDQVTIWVAGTYNGGLGVFSSWVHVWHTEDGKRTRVVITNDVQNPSSFWIFDEIDPIPGEWATIPELVAVYEGSTAMSFRSGQLANIPPLRAAKSYDGTSGFDVGVFSLGLDSMSLGFGGFSWVTAQDFGAKGNQLNDDEPFPMAPIGLTSNTVGFRGVHGILADLYAGHESKNGVTYPISTTEKLWAQFNDVILPWTGRSDIPIELPNAPILGIVTDESINTNDGTPTNMEIADFQDDTPGGNFSTVSSVFDGVNEHIVIGDVAPLQFERTDPFSISFWFKAFQFASIDTIVGKMDNPSGVGYEVDILTTGQLLIQLRVTTTTNQMRIDTVKSWNDGAWHHVVTTWDGDVAGGAAGAAIYVDGIIQEVTVFADTLTGSLLGTWPFQIAARDGAIAPYQGSIDDVAVYDRELTPFEVATIYNNANTEIGFSYNSITFDGTNEHVNVGDVSELKFSHTDQFSISAWARWSASSGMIVSKQLSSGTFRGYFMSVSNGAINAVVRNTITTNEASVITTATNFDDEQWHHIVITWNGTLSTSASNLSIYVDGVDQSLSILADNLSATIDSTASFSIGSRNGANTFFDGKIDDVAVYDKELSSSEVITIYNNGLPNDLRLSGPTSNLVGYWLMGDNNDSFPNILDRASANDGTMTNMEAIDITHCVPINVAPDGSPNDLRINGPDGYLVGYWLMGEGVIAVDLATETTENGVLIGFGATAGTGETEIFVMVGIDTGAAPSAQPFYHYWTVTGQADPTGAFAIGPDAPPFGGPLTNIYVSAQYKVVI